jgi:hypothetical protein
MKNELRERKLEKVCNLGAGPVGSHALVLS